MCGPGTASPSSVQMQDRMLILYVFASTRPVVAWQGGRASQNVCMQFVSSEGSNKQNEGAVWELGVVDHCKS
jgi:hypothetical protein